TCRPRRRPPCRSGLTTIVRENTGGTPMRRRTLVWMSVICAAGWASIRTASASPSTAASRAEDHAMTSPIDPRLSSAEIAEIAEEAYVYAFPMMIAYGFFHRQTQGPDAPEKQAIGRFTHFRTLGSPTLNNTIPWINTDTLYSAAWLDLKPEPYVLSVPAFEPHRFQNVQAADWQ